jgi:hypothetical protein
MATRYTEEFRRDAVRIAITSGRVSPLYDLNIRYRYLAAGETNCRKRDVAAEHEDILDAVCVGKRMLPRLV